MRELMTRFKSMVRDRNDDRKHGKQTGDGMELRKGEPAEWEMSSDDALRAPIVSGYK
jgi:hypothetical protein